MRQLYSHFAVTEGVTIAALAAGLSGISGDHILTNIQTLQSHSRTLMLERNARRQLENLPPRPVPENKRWSSSTVLGILRNPRYAGFSVYTDRTQRATGNKRRSWYAQVLRDDNNEPVKGQWEPIVSEDICGPCSAA